MEQEQSIFQQTFCDILKENLIYNSKFSIEGDLSIKVDNNEWVRFKFQRNILKVRRIPAAQKYGQHLTDTNDNNRNTSSCQQSDVVRSSDGLTTRKRRYKDVMTASPSDDCPEAVKGATYDAGSADGSCQHCLVDRSMGLPQGVQLLEDICDKCGGILHRVLISNVHQGVAICGVVISHIQQLLSPTSDGSQPPNEKAQSINICRMQSTLSDSWSQTTVTIAPSAVLNVQTIQHSSGVLARDKDNGFTTSTPTHHYKHPTYDMSGNVLDLSLTSKQNIMQQDTVTRTDEPLSGMYDVNRNVTTEGHNIHGRTPYNTNQAVTEGAIIHSHTGQMITTPNYMHGLTEDVTGHTMIPPSEISHVGTTTHNNTGHGMIPPSDVEATTHIGYGMVLPNAVHNITHGTTAEHHNNQAISITPAVHVIQDNTTQNQSQPGVNSITDTNIAPPEGASIHSHMITTPNNIQGVPIQTHAIYEIVPPPHPDNIVTHDPTQYKTLYGMILPNSDNEIHGIMNPPPVNVTTADITQRETKYRNIFPKADITHCVTPDHCAIPMTTILPVVTGNTTTHGHTIPVISNSTSGNDVNQDSNLLSNTLPEITTSTNGNGNSQDFRLMNNTTPGITVSTHINGIDQSTTSLNHTTPGITASTHVNSIDQSTTSLNHTTPGITASTRANVGNQSTCNRVRPGTTTGLTEGVIRQIHSPNDVSIVDTTNDHHTQHATSPCTDVSDVSATIPNAAHNIPQGNTTVYHNTHVTSIPTAVQVVIQDNTSKTKTAITTSDIVSNGIPIISLTGITVPADAYGVSKGLNIPSLTGITVPTYVNDVSKGIPTPILTEITIPADANVVRKGLTTRSLTRPQINTLLGHDITTTGSSYSSTEAKIPTLFQNITRAYTNTAGSLLVSITVMFYGVNIHQYV